MAKHRICPRCHALTPADGRCTSCAATRRQRTQLDVEVYDTAEWRRLAARVKERDGYTCQLCGAHGPDVELHADHVIPLSQGGPPFDERNVRTLCRDCNLARRTFR